MVKEAFSKKKSFYQQIGLKFKEETSKVLTWSIALHGAQTRMLEHTW
jgi:hypothetical protein